VLLLSWYYNPGSFSYRTGWIIHFAPILFLLWLAWTDLEKIPWWHWIIMFVVLVICAVKPGFWLLGIPIIGYIIFARHKK